MRKRKSKHTHWGTNPFQFYSEMFTATMQMAELYTSSGQVIAHRTAMMARALKGEISLVDKEFIDMWQEKFAAGQESLSAAMKHMSSPHAQENSLKGMMNAITPYSKRAKANAKRLGKSKKY